MYKTAIAIVVILLLLVTWSVYLYNAGASNERMEQKVGTLEESAKVSKEAKEAGEQATIRADQSKSQVVKAAKAYKEKLSVQEDDNEPLSRADLDLLCDLYGNTDGICASPSKPTPSK